MNLTDLVKSDFNDQSVMQPKDFVDIAGTKDDKVLIPLMKAYFEEYGRTMQYGLPKSYYVGFIKGKFKFNDE